MNLQQPKKLSDNMSNKIKTNCILLKKQPYSESSVILQVFSDTQGLISVLCKGIRKHKQHKDYLLNVLNEYELIITSGSQSGLHTLTELSLIKEYPADLTLETWFNAQAGAEILTRLLLPHDEIPLFYKALSQYLDYLVNTPENSIAIFWRYLLHIDKLLGVPINLKECSVCHKEMPRPAGFAADSGRLVCHNCLPSLPSSITFTAESANILMLLPVIGNYLQDIVINNQTAIQLNNFFLNYLSLQFHKPIHLNSLQYIDDNKKGLPE